MIYPEIELEKEGEKERYARIESIHNYMLEYKKHHVLSHPRKVVQFVHRECNGHSRDGILLNLDLERYDWKPDSKTMVRASEGTVESRLPVRARIRRGAALDMPHIIVLVDDRDQILFPLVASLLKSAPVNYAVELYGNAGKVWGKQMRRINDWAFLGNCFEFLERQSRTCYGDAFLFAVGDGNHSLAAAKQVWEEYKQAHAGSPGLEEHPLRFAMVEVENIYDPGIIFEPIHRVVYNCTLEAVKSVFSGMKGVTFASANSEKEAREFVAEKTEGRLRYALASGSEYCLVEAESDAEIATVPLEKPLDGLIAANQGALISEAGSKPQALIDYIHGEAELFRLAKEPGKHTSAVAILLPPFEKKGLFETIARYGPLPRKSFSMGDAEEKRFYLECRNL
jgi:uncharacterized protein (DUF1015 family)